MTTGENAPKRWWETLPGVLTATAGIITAITGLLVVLNQAGWLGSASAPAANSQRTPTAASSPAALSASPAPTVVIDGPSAVPLGENAYYQVTSQNAVRGVWSIGGFTNAPVTVDPLGLSHQIRLQPTDAGRVGENFTIVFTAYGADGRSVTATKQFLVSR